MKESVQIEFESEHIKCFITGKLAVLKMSCNAFDTLTNLDQANKVLPWFDRIENEKSIKGILGITDKNCLGQKSYEQFLSEITGRKIEAEKDSEITKFEKTDIRAIEINMLMNLIRKIYSFKKIFISAVYGEVVTPFLGLNLVSDFRIGSESFRILFSHAKYGLHPSGALPLLLPQFLNRQEAAKYLLLGGTISAEEALKKHLINEILPDENFEENAIKKAAEYLDVSFGTMRSAKALMNFNIKELENYFSIESNYTLK